MGLLKRSADLVYALRFIRIMAMRWEDTEAFKLGLIDKDGKRIKEKEIKTSDEKSSYTPFVKLAFNVKRLIGKVSGGSRIVSTLAGAMLLLKEKYSIDEKILNRVLTEKKIDHKIFLSESTKWFVVADEMLSPGIYRIRNESLLKESFEDIVRKGDIIRVEMDCYPRGEIFGVSVYEVTHLPTRQQMYVTAGELIK